MSILMQSLVVGALFYLADYVLQTNTMIVLAFVFVPLIAGVPLTAWFRARLGVVGAQQFLLVVAGVGLLLMMVVPDALILPCLALAGFGLAGPQTLTNVLFAQVADEDELRCGVRREGAFFGVNALITNENAIQHFARESAPEILLLVRLRSFYSNLVGWRKQVTPSGESPRKRTGDFSPMDSSLHSFLSAIWFQWHQRAHKEGVRFPKN